MTKYKQYVEKRFNVQLEDYPALWEWSVRRENLGKFWNSVWDYTEVIGEKGQEEVSSLSGKQQY